MAAPNKEKRMMAAPSSGEAEADQHPGDIH